MRKITHGVYVKRINGSIGNDGGYEKKHFNVKSFYQGVQNNFYSVMGEWYEIKQVQECFLKYVPKTIVIMM